MKAAGPPPVAGRDEPSLAIADALLEGGRALPPLSAAVHARIKRRLLVSTRTGLVRRARWLAPAVIASFCLVCGAAFGVVLDRLVLKRGPSASTPTETDTVTGARATRSRRSVSKPPAPTASEAEAEPEPAKVQSGAPKMEARATTDESSAVDSTLPARSPTGARKVALRSFPAAVVPVAAQSAERVEAPVSPPAVAPEPPSPARVATAPAAPLAAHAPAAVPTAARSADFAPSVGREPISEERLLAAAVRALRAENDPRLALSALDEYQARYPRGRMLVEAQVLRVDALSALKRNPEALRILDGLALAQMPGGIERQLQRGELRAGAGRYREAEADFSGVLARAPVRDLASL